MRHSLYIGALVAVWTLAGVGLLDLRAAHGQAGPPGEVINQARKALLLTPSDSADLALGPTRGLWNGTGVSCTIGVMLADDSAGVTLSNVPAGPLPLRVKRLMSTGTSCTGIVGFW